MPATYQGPGNDGAKGADGVSGQNGQPAVGTAQGGAAGQDGNCSIWGNTRPTDGDPGGRGPSGNPGTPGTDGRPGERGWDGQPFVLDASTISGTITLDFHGGRGGEIGRASC